MKSATRIVSKVLAAGDKLRRYQLDSERMCFLVTDQEWNELVAYAGQYNFEGCSEPNPIACMHYGGIEVIKRSAIERVQTERMPK